MHVVQVTTLFHPHRGGIETMVRALAAAIAAGEGDRCTVLTRRTRGLARESVVNGVPVRRVGGDPGGRLAARLRFLLAGRRLLRREAADIDLVHAHSLYIPALLACLGRPPAVATVHTAGPTGNLADLGRSGLGRLRLRLYRRRLRAVVALTAGMADEVAAAGFPRERIVVIPNGVDAEHFSPPDAARRLAARGRHGVLGEGPLVAFLGRLEREKGADVLLAAWPEICRRVPGAHLVIAGEGGEAACLHAAAAKTSAAASHSIHWPGAVADARDVYHAADVLVVPSRAEAFGVVALEGMACGVAVVASRVGGLEEAVGDAATLVSPEDPEALAAAVAGLLGDPALRDRQGQAGRARVLERFTLEHVVGLHRELYQRVLRGHPPAETT